MTLARPTLTAIAVLAAVGAACGGGTHTPAGNISAESTARAFSLAASPTPTAPRAESPRSSASPPPRTPTATATGAQRACDDPSAAARVRPSVVRIDAGRGTGTGVIVAADLVITAEHVVENVQSVRLTLHDGRTVSATVLARRADHDLAALRVTATGLTPAVWGDDRALRPGQPLLALGFALDIPGEPSLTGGRFSARRTERGVDLIQTDAPLNPGNSGGPVFTQCGEVVGIVSFGLVEAQGLNLAVAARHARDLAANPGRVASLAPSGSPRPATATATRTATATAARTPTSTSSPPSSGAPSAAPSATPRPSPASRRTVSGR